MIVDSPGMPLRIDKQVRPKAAFSVPKLLGGRCRESPNVPPLPPTDSSSPADPLDAQVLIEAPDSSADDDLVHLIEEELRIVLSEGESRDLALQDREHRLDGVPPHPVAGTV